ncbi:MAG: PEP-CTERM sorting domain-containing protein [Verrucomicrobia bacterium]|nr:PEP-CTERM sorting domain-containing protein [Verrucomicrobiota bacterium]
MTHSSERGIVWIVGFLSAILIGGISALAADPSPTYLTTVGDDVTGDNEFVGSDGKRRWTVDAGADDYQNEIYERPTIDSFDTVDGVFSTQQYYQNLDIIEGKVGWDSQFLYVSIEMYGRAKSDQGGDSIEGMKYEYGFRFSTDPDGRYGYLVRTEFGAPLSSPVFVAEKNLVFLDTDGDIGGRGGPLFGNPGPTGLGVTKQDNPLEESGGASGSMNGYDSQLVADGALLIGLNAGEEVVFSRINPDNLSIVEIAFDYTAFGLTLDDISGIGYMDLQAIKGSPTDPQNYFWNDKWTKLEAGSPYDLADFGAQNGVGGYNAIDELDTLRICIPDTMVPEPGTISLLALGGLLILRKRR